MEATAVIRRPAGAEGLTAYGPDQVRAQVNRIQEIMSSVMIRDTHYGSIPGTGDRQVLLKAGAEKLLFTFRLCPIIGPGDIIQSDYPGGHREFRVTAHILTSSGEEIATGIGSCSTMESKYRWRKAERTCPSCHGSFIIKGKEEYGGGWLCFGKKGGCGAKFPDGDQAIEGQKVGQVENSDIADVYNTVLKMAKKRAVIDGTISATAASDIFTQDIDEMAEFEVVESKKPSDSKPATTTKAKAKGKAAPSDDGVHGPTPEDYGQMIQTMKQWLYGCPIEKLDGAIAKAKSKAANYPAKWKKVALAAIKEVDEALQEEYESVEAIVEEYIGMIGDRPKSEIEMLCGTRLRKDHDQRWAEYGESMFRTRTAPQPRGK